MRPNIRVEIQNNLVENMEVDDNEEGEISDEEDLSSQDSKTIPHSSQEEPTRSIIPSKGLEPFDREKLNERAKRFQLNPEEIRNFTDDELLLLHGSLGITSSNESNVRFEVIHMRGIDQLNAGDILEYFLEYAPVSVEWVDEESCNVLWSDRLSAARALHFISKPVRGMPVRDDRGYFDTEDASEENQSILLINKDREVQLEHEEDIAMNKLLNEKNSVDISEITTTIPPGYWRLGKKHPNYKCLLLRFSLKTDKKPFKNEQFSKYYKGQGKKISSRGVTGIFGRNKEMNKPSAQTNDNPWSTLAKNWDEDAQFREHERKQEDEPKIEIKNQSLRVRLGAKRKETKSLENEQDDEKEIEPPKKIKIPRMRMYADEEEEKLKRRKLLTKLNHQIKKIDDPKSTDLRKVLNMNSRTYAKPEPEPEVFDLGTRLKNRSKKMVFEIKTEMDQIPPPVKERSGRSSWRDNDRLGGYRRPDRRQNYSSRHNFQENEEELVQEDEEEEEYEEEEFDTRAKPKSKVAVVIRTQKKPTVASAVASTVWSRVGKANSESESSDSSSSESPSEEEEEVIQPKTQRPGFSSQSRESSQRKPLKIEINNDHFKK